MRSPFYAKSQINKVARSRRSHFGVAINDQLDDEILVSVIASDFEEEVDFSKPSVFKVPTREQEEVFKTPEVPNFGEQSQEAKKEETSITDDSILPSFLRD